METPLTLALVDESAWMRRNRLAATLLATCARWAFEMSTLAVVRVITTVTP